MIRRPNMQQIADALNTSPMTVSRALRGQKGVSEELKQRIVAYAREIGYITDSMGSRNTSAPQTNIALLVADFFISGDQRIYIDFYKKLLEELHKSGALSILKILEESETDALILPDLLQNDAIRGLIVLGELPAGYIALLQTLKLPMMLLDFYDDDLNLDAVINDNFFGAYELTRYLIRRGHREIAYVGNIHITHSIQDRYLGYKKALLTAGITVGPDYLISDRNRIGEFKELSLPNPLPTAFVCNCDEIACTLVSRLTAQGVRIPEDCSVVSFDNSRFSTLCRPGLTTMASNLEEMSRACVNSLLQKVESPSVKTGIISVKGSLIERDSVCVPAKK